MGCRCCVFQCCVCVWLEACSRIHWCSVGDMAVFQQTVPDWHGDSSHSELEGGLPCDEGAGASWLLGHGALRRGHLAQSAGPQAVERGCHFHPQSPSHEETVCWMQTGEVSSNAADTGHDIATVLMDKRWITWTCVSLQYKWPKCIKWYWLTQT